MNIIVVGLSHRTAPVEVRERLAFPPNLIEKPLRELVSLEDISEGLIVSTCNRVEIYATTRDIGGGLARVKRFLADHHGLRSAARLCTAALAAVTLAVLLVPPTPALLAVTVFVVGGAAAGLLTLGMVEAAQGEHAEDITTRVQQVSLVYTALSACGPALAGLLIEHSGQPALLWALQGLLVAVLVGLLRGRPAAYTASS